MNMLKARSLLKSLNDLATELGPTLDEIEETLKLADKSAALKKAVVTAEATYANVQAKITEDRAALAKEVAEWAARRKSEADAHATQLDGYRTKVEADLEATRAAMSQRLAQLRAEADALAKDNAAAKIEGDRARSQTAALRQELADLKARILA